MSRSVISCSFLLVIVVVGIFGSLTKDVHGDPQVPCFFAFGDSLSDPGNNNGLRTMAKANYMPYGIDFPGSIATGRFTNNFTFVDILTQLLGFNHLLPPYNLTPLIDQEIVDGVNYASGSAGILFETGKAMGQNIALGQQIINHKIIASRIAAILKAPAFDHLQKCLYTINIGSNDYLNNYFVPEQYPTNRIYTPEAFATMLIDHYANHIMELHALGARKFAIYGLGYLGCTLAAIKKFGPGSSGCVDNVNSAAVLFNDKLVPLVDSLNNNVKDSQFTYINSTSIGPATGLVVNKSCCPVRSDGQCEPQSTPCSNRNEYYFWDLFHPTGQVNTITGHRAYKAQEPADVRPVDISTLVKHQ